jgi:hypothetical protein
VALGSTPISRTFLVRNEDNADLTIVTVTVPSGFPLTEDLPRNLAARSSDTFTVELDTSAAGTKTGDVVLVSNDRDRNPVTFRTTGTITP